MNRARQQILSCSRFPRDQDAHIARRDLASQLEYLLHPLRRPDEFVKPSRALLLRTQKPEFLFGLVEFVCASKYKPELDDIGRPRHRIVRAVLDDLATQQVAVVAQHDDNGRWFIALLDSVHQP